MRTRLKEITTAFRSHWPALTASVLVVALFVATLTIATIRYNRVADSRNAALASERSLRTELATETDSRRQAQDQQAASEAELLKTKAQIPDVPASVLAACASARKDFAAAYKQQQDWLDAHLAGDYANGPNAYDFWLLTSGAPDRLRANTQKLKAAHLPEPWVTFVQEFDYAAASLDERSQAYTSRADQGRGMVLIDIMCVGRNPTAPDKFAYDTPAGIGAALGGQAPVVPGAAGLPGWTRDNSPNNRP